jgi:hypothetical protein
VKPSLGRIVLTPADPATNNGADVAPAVVTRVWSDTMINVRVLLDTPEVPPSKTSITLYDSPEAMEAARVQRDESAPHLVGAPMHAAFWPPRI